MPFEATSQLTARSIKVAISTHRTEIALCRLAIRNGLRPADLQRIGGLRVVFSDGLKTWRYSFKNGLGEKIKRDRMYDTAMAIKSLIKDRQECVTLLKNELAKLEPEKKYVANYTRKRNQEVAA